MSESKTKSANRNSYVDIVRGIAMLLVILGHTITGCTEGAEDSFLFNIIWSLQMPLFVLVSGYVTRYSRRTESASALRKYVKRRTIAYLLPWVVWTFLVRGLIFKKTHFFNIGWLLYHMDAGYWFLTTIWTISMIFGVSTFFASKAANSHEKRRHILVFVFYCIGMAILAGIGLLMGMSFLGIRLTLYYMPFYFAGYLYGQLRDRLQSTERGIKFTEIIVAVCLVVWLFILVRVPLYSLSDSGLTIVLRAGASLTGSIAICGLCKKVFDDENSRSSVVGGGAAANWNSFNGNVCYPLSISDSSSTGSSSDGIINSRITALEYELCNSNHSDNSGNSHIKQKHSATTSPLWKTSITRFFYWSGRLSLELYVVHGLLLNMLYLKTPPSFSSVLGLLLSMGNFVLTLMLSAIVICLVRKNKVLCMILGVRQE